MRILFLDIDGVMIPSGADTNVDRWAFGEIPESCSNALNEIITITKCEIVMSSDRRNNHSLKEMRDIFEYYGIYKGPIGYTPRSKLYTGNNLENGRADEILQWVERHAWKDDIKWCAVDDMNMEEQLYPHFVRCTNDLTGISEPLVMNQIIKKLR